MSEGEFSVCQFFSDGSYEYVRRFVSDEEAVLAAIHYSSSVGAKLGTTQRVIITDGGDCINWEWEFGKGITYPPELADYAIPVDSEPS
jgi:hypothetical protein